jgi:hypothetical protein
MCKDMWFESICESTQIPRNSPAYALFFLLLQAEKEQPDSSSPAFV